MDSSVYYRYLRDEAAIKTIEARAFRVSRLLELNDPFEWHIGFEGAPPGREEEYEKVLMDGLREQANRDVGIICFSKKINDPVLWSHYTNIHRGIAFAINMDVNPHLTPSLHQVVYDKPPVVIPIQRHKQMSKNEKLELIRDLGKQKSSSWRYEQEFRLVMALKECRPSGGSYLWDKMPPSFITHAIIGFRSSVSEQYLRQALDLNGFQHTQVLKAKRSQTTYEIKLEPMTMTQSAVLAG